MQLALPTAQLNRLRVVNVASVPQRSPFRYPGGKSWLVPVIRRWLSNRPRPTEFVEPFAGGGSISLAVAAERMANHVTMVELDEQVASVWQTVFNQDGAAWLGQQIVSFELTSANLQRVLAQPASSQWEMAFQTILRNRVNRGGILARGAGMIREGEGGKGLLSRWYPATLRRRIDEAVALAGCISFIAGEGLSLLTSYADDRHAAFYLDPPYSAAGKRAGLRLYNHALLDHQQLFALAAQLTGDVLMTYDDTAEVRELARQHGFSVHPVPIKSTHHAVMQELLISRDLSWL